MNTIKTNKLHNQLQSKLEENMGYRNVRSRKRKTKLHESDLHINSKSRLEKYIQLELNDYVKNETDIERLIAVLKFATGKSVVSNNAGYTVMQKGHDMPNDDFMKDTEQDMSFR